MPAAQHVNGCIALTQREKTVLSVVKENSDEG
jgi:hypothetical protein